MCSLVMQIYHFCVTNKIKPYSECCKYEGIIMNTFIPFVYDYRLSAFGCKGVNTKCYAA